MANANELQAISNPLLLDLVVDKLFEYLPLEDIINHRRVCRLWQETGLKCIRKDIDHIELSFGSASNSPQSIEKFLEMSTSFSFKFTNVSTHYWDDKLKLLIHNAQQAKRLFDEYGAHLKVISLDLSGTTNGWTFLSDVLVNKSPNVEQLRLESDLQGPETISNRLFSGERKSLKLKRLTLLLRNGTDKTLLADLFASSPCLESINVAVEYGDGIYYEIAPLLQIFADKGNVSNLKELHLGLVDNNVLAALVTSFKSAPLENLKIQIYRICSPTMVYVETFFDDHKDTLKNVNITFPCVQFFSSFTFPKIKNLKILSISDWYCFKRSMLHVHRDPFETFNFGGQFPNLVSLHLFDRPKSTGPRYCDLDRMFPAATTPLMTLKNLKLLPISDPGMFRRLGRIFPNVVKLFLVPQTPDVLTELWTTWPEMKMLHISIMPFPSCLCTNLNSVFTGVAGSDRSRNFSSISNLKKLRHLKIDAYSYITVSPNVTYLKITDETARLALSEMKELVSLHISWEHHELSPSCVEYLRTKLDMLETEPVTEDLHLVKYEWQKRSRWSMLLDYV